MNRTLKKEVKWIFALCAATFSLLTVGCGKDSATMRTEEKPVASDTQKDRENYEAVLKQDVTVNGSKKVLEIVQNEKDVSDVVITVDGEEAELSRVSIGAGYVHAEGKAADVTGDGEEEIILLLGGGASGLPLEMQVLEQTDQGWKEIVFPDALWESDNRIVALDKHKNSLDIRVDATNSSKTLKLTKKQRGADAEIKYQICKLEGNQLFVQYDVYLEGNPEPAAAVLQEVVYDEKSGQFQYGKTKIDQTGSDLTKE